MMFHQQLYAILLSVLPRYDWWFWNVLEVVLRLCAIPFALVAMLMSAMGGDSGDGKAVFAVPCFMMSFFLLTIALIIRHWTLGVVSVSIIPITLFLLSFWPDRPNKARAKVLQRE
jgi:hypothetical protein